MSLGGVGDFKPVDAEATEAFQAVQPEAVTKLGSESFELVEYATQVVAGLKFFIKVKVGEDTYQVVIWRNPQQQFSLEEVTKQ